MKIATYNKEQFEEIVKNNISVAGSLRGLKLRPAGANYKWFHRKINEYGIDISHFTGGAWSRGLKLGPSNRAQKIEEILVENSTFTSTNNLKKKLFSHGIKQQKCEVCNNSIWNNKPIPLELHHLNGNNTDHRVENLIIICANCHAQTSHYRGRNKLSCLNERREQNCVKFGELLSHNEIDNPEPSLDKNEEGVETLRRRPKLSKCVCGNDMTYRAKRCRECDFATRGNQYKRPPVFQLIEDFKELKTAVAIGKKYGVSDVTIRHWCIVYQIEDMVKRKSSAQTSE